MKCIATAQLNSFLETEQSGTTKIYGESFTEFRPVECKDLEDFQENAEFGQCWTDKEGETYFKVKNDFGDALSIYFDEKGTLLEL